MSNNILKLQEIGIKEVSKKTHIEIEYLEYMCDKNYEKLKKLNAFGYAKIISREYDIDLSDWCEEFRAYCSEHPGEDGCTFCVSPKIPAYTSKEEGGSWIWVLVIVAVLVGFVWIFGFTKYFDNFMTFFDDENKSVTYSNTAVVETAKESLNLDSNMSIENIVKDMSDINATDENQTSVSKELTDSEILPDENTTANTLFQPLEAATSNENLTAQALIAPTRNIWVGIKYLDNGSKRSFTTSKAIDLNLSRDAIVLTGHGELIFSANDENTTYKSKNPLRFLIKDASIKPIDFEEYVKINKGEKW
ncbi:hypothetical protein CIG2463D_0307 [Campylobacter iguaniorum]|uniref:Phosphatidylglycerophosphate synthase n=1 Tax=Campylobacter iguaniorum TaxID=1244531 RepID=A0A076F902_9BACT|nr:hypothetical protein [Campylobacter iguaniorum]AII14173.1 hypothetical protein CIG1485E_0302 [Campylobacter iguaniorum]ALV23912.1 hypothetical protein CIG2463D_0307 [Campylobacter iguaniorum]